MRPDFGNRLGDYLFENIGATTAALVKNEIKGTIARFEPRVALDDIEVREGAGGLGTISVEIAYRILSTGMTDRLAIDIGR
jgi:phage baseplate assembly protein W